MYGEHVILMNSADRSGRQHASHASLVGLAVLCAALGFIGTRAYINTTTQLIAPAAAKSAIVGAAVASMATGATLPFPAPEQVTLPVSQQVASVAHGGTQFAKVADAPPLPEELQELDVFQLAALALFVPVLGYASWTVGAKKAQADLKDAKEKYEKDLEQGNVVKVSPSGIPTVRGLPMSSDQGWKIQADDLRAKGIQGLKGEEAIQAKANGAIIVDVRSKERYEQGYIPGSINIPLFQPITGWDFFKVARRFQFAIFGVSGTEYNADFMKDFKEKVGNATGDVVFVDDSVRGTLTPTIAFPDGKPGHALMAIYLASTSGFKAPMKYVEGGVVEYGAAGGEMITPPSA